MILLREKKRSCRFSYQRRRDNAIRHLAVDLWPGNLFQFPSDYLRQLASLNFLKLELQKRIQLAIRQNASSLKIKN